MLAEILAYEDSRQAPPSRMRALLLEERDPWVRERAALALGRIGDPASVELLLEALRDRYARVRQTAAFALGEIEDQETLQALGYRSDPRVVPALLAALRDESAMVRARAAEALGKIGDRRAVSALIDMLGAAMGLDPSEPSRQADPRRREYISLLLTALFRLRDPAALMPLLLVAQDPDPELRWRAANAIYRLLAARPSAPQVPAVAAREVLKGSLKDMHPLVRAHAARALGLLPYNREERESAAAALLGLLEDQSLEVQIEAINALGRLEAAGAVAPLGEKLERLLEAEARQGKEFPGKLINLEATIINALGQIGAPAKRQRALLSRLRFRPDVVGDAVEMALARVLRGDDSYLEPLAGGKLAARFRQPQRLRAAAAALAEHGSGRAGELLLELLKSPATAEEKKLIARAKPAILAALIKLRPPGLEHLLAAELADADEVVRKVAAEGLGRLAEHGAASPRALEALLRAAADKSGANGSEGYEARAALLEAIARFDHHPAAIRALRSALAHDERLVRIRAAALLRSLTGSDYSTAIGASATRNSEIVYALLAEERRSDPIAVIDTEKGRIEALLFRDDAPLTVDNFIKLAREGFYNGLTFMRVVPNFVVQGGDPRNDQEGGPGYTIRCEINQRSFLRGHLGMALAGKDTGGSQFFICILPQPHLDGGYTNFGRVISGMSVVEDLVAGDKILNVTIRERPFSRSDLVE